MNEAELRATMGDELYNEIDSLAKHLDVPFAIVGHAVIGIMKNKKAGMTVEEADETAIAFIETWREKLRKQEAIKC